MTVLEKVKELVQKKGITLAKLEREMGFANGSIVKWEVSAPSIAKVVKVADYFDVSVDFLLGKSSSNQLIHMLHRSRTNDNVHLSDADMTEIFNFIQFKYQQTRGKDV